MSTARDLDAPELFESQDYAASANLFVCHAGSRRGGLRSYRFDTAADAIAFALTNFASRRPSDVVLTVEDKRFNLDALRAIERQDGAPSGPCADIASA